MIRLFMFCFGVLWLFAGGHMVHLNLIERTHRHPIDRFMRTLAGLIMLTFGLLTVIYGVSGNG